MSFGNCFSVFSDFSFDFSSIFCIGDFNFTRFSNQTIIFWFGGFPPPTVCTAAALANEVRLHCIIICIERATNFERFQIFFLKSSFVIHIPPGTAFIVHINNISLHLWNQRVIADDFSGSMRRSISLYPAMNHSFLILAVAVFGRHVGGDSHHTAFFNPVKAEIECGFIAPIDGGNDPEPFGCPVSAAPTIAKYIIRTWKNPVISMVLAQQARGFIPFRYDN